MLVHWNILLLLRRNEVILVHPAGIECDSIALPGGVEEWWQCNANACFEFQQIYSQRDFGRYVESIVIDGLHVDRSARFKWYQCTISETGYCFHRELKPATSRGCYPTLVIGYNPESTNEVSIIGQGFVSQTSVDCNMQ